jgi:general L-amino acid transport system permease protein
VSEVTRGAEASTPRDRGPGRRGRRGGIAALIFDVRVLRITGQVAAIVLLLAIAIYLRDNYQANIEDRNLRTGWGFLDEPTGFNIPYADFRAGQPVRDALWVGVRNTAISAAAGIVIATIVGVLIGVLRLSTSWVARKAATLYVEVVRNVPVLLIILFTSSWLATLPRIADARRLGDFAVISNRQISIMSPVAGDTLLAYGILLAASVVAARWVWAWRTRVSDATGEPHHRVLWAGGLVAVVGVVGYLVLDGPITWSRPVLTGNTVVGGISMNIPYVALTAALALYHASHIAEIVRGSIQAVPHGQTEAATAIGLSNFARLRYVILPQAFRIAVPPTLNQYLSLTKNTSLGIAVAYAEVSALGFQLIGGSRAAALQTILILMVIYLAFSLTTSLVMNLFNRRLQLVER